MKKAQLLAMTAMAFGAGLMDSGKERIPLAWKPTFTDEEIAYLQTLPKKEKRLEVKRLRAKYLAEL